MAEGMKVKKKKERWKEKKTTWKHNKGNIKQYTKLRVCYEGINEGKRKQNKWNSKAMELEIVENN